MQAHILNGDALTDRMQAAGFTNLYVCREALIDGPLRADTPQAYWDARANFLTDNHPEEYQQTITEFERIKEIPAEAEINLWFGDDLFCQANMWFMIDYLYSLDRHHRLYRVFPIIKENRWNDYAFHTPPDLQFCFDNRVAFQDPQLPLNLWTAYSNHDLQTLASLSHTDHPCFRWLDEVVQAHIERSTIRRPEETLKTILQNGVSDFGSIFQSFQQKEGIYGFGDVQVKNILQSIQ